MMKRLFELGCRPLYDTFREVNVATGITTATWRVYFVSTSCPFPLMKNGTVCDQVMFGGRLFPAHGKTAPYPSELRSSPLKVFPVLVRVSLRRRLFGT
ncbi:hypothetical protein Plhal304r1_c014g0052041 [Plasmopara halstedii]